MFVNGFKNGVAVGTALVGYYTGFGVVCFAVYGVCVTAPKVVKGIKDAVRNINIPKYVKTSTDEEKLEKVFVETSKE